MHATVVVDHDEARRDAFLAEVGRLRREVRQLTAHIERVEAQFRNLLDDLVRERLEAYR